MDVKIRYQLIEFEDHVSDRFAILKTNDMWLKGDVLAQWLGNWILDQDVPGSSPARAPFVVALSKSHLPLA